MQFGRRPEYKTASFDISLPCEPPGRRHLLHGGLKSLLALLRPGPRAAPFCSRKRNGASVRGLVHGECRKLLG